jgi:tetratricopeptide (TPR) repeat protein
MNKGQQQMNEIAELSKQAYVLLKHNNVGEAKNLFSHILELDANNNYALVGMGDAERKLSNYEQAIGYYQQCLEAFPDNNYALFGLADCYKALNMYEKAIQIWEQYLTHDGKNITVLTRIADAYRKFRNFKKSKEIYLRVLDMETENSYALIGLGHLHYDFKEYAEALEYWMRVLKKYEQAVDIRVLTSIGNCHRKLKTFENGVIFFERALERDPKNFYALFGLADCYRGMNQQTRSIEYWSRILEIDPRNKVILTRVGDAYRNSGDYDSAVSYYERALDIDFDEYALMGLALIGKAQGNYEASLERLNWLIQATPKNYRFYVDAADCYLKLNQKKKAITMLQTALSVDPKNQTVVNMLDAIYEG